MQGQDPHNTSSIPLFCEDQLALKQDDAWLPDDPYKALFEQLQTRCEGQLPSTQDDAWPPDNSNPAFEQLPMPQSGVEKLL